MDDEKFDVLCCELDKSFKHCKVHLHCLRLILSKLALYDQVKICDSMYDDLLDLIDQVNDAL